MVKERNRAIAVLGIVFFSVLLFSCGIETLPFLYAPAASDITSPLEGESTFTFRNYTDNNINYFKGYEVYYKFYSVNTEDEKLKNETQIIDLTEGSDQARTRLLSFNYRRLFELDVFTMSPSLSVPLIPVETEALKKSGFSVTLDFRYLNIDDGYARIEYLDSSFKTSRYVKKSGDQDAKAYSFIAPDFDENFDDFQTSLYTQDNPFVYLVLYVMAYGQYDLINDIYSRPVQLGKIRLRVDEG